LKDAVAKLVLLIMMFITFVGCSSCVSSSYLFGPGDLFRDKRRSFIKIDIYKNVFISKTSSITSEPNLEEYEISLRSSASGFIVGHDREITLVATSAHVCSITFGNQINHFVPDYSSNDPSWKLKERSSFILSDYKGHAYASIPIVFNLETDICILGTTKFSLPALTISKKNPLIGEKYYNIAAPMGLWSDGMIPLFEGYYLGKMKIRKNRRISYGFSIPTKGGSSGSPILNKYGEVVGATHSAYRGFENLCMATTNVQIYMTYRKALRNLLRDYEKYRLIVEMINL
tara:strand:+ start:455 stop:1315 length:861 start_codon:yes stop_codon:yes gene_type:complete